MVDGRIGHTGRRCGSARWMGLMGMIGVHPFGPRLLELAATLRRFATDGAAGPAARCEHRRTRSGNGLLECLGHHPYVTAAPWTRSFNFPERSLVGATTSRSRSSLTTRGSRQTNSLARVLWLEPISYFDSSLRHPCARCVPMQVSCCDQGFRGLARHVVVSPVRGSSITTSRAQLVSRHAAIIST